MGIGMPKFVTNGYNRFTDTCHGIREGWRAAKLIFTMMRKLDMSKDSGVKNPEEFLNTIKNTEDLPDTFKVLLNSVDNNTLQSAMKVAAELFAKSHNNPDNPINKNEVISKMVDAMKESKKSDDVQENEGTKHVLEDAAREHANSSNKDATKSDASSTTDNKTKSKAEDTQQTPVDDDGYIPSQTQKSIYKMTRENNSEFEKEATKGSSGRNETPKFRSAKEYQEFTRNNPNEDGTERKPDTSFIPNSKGKTVPPMTDFLRKEFQKKFGPNWRQQIPPFMKNPNANPIPDIGLGLSKQQNSDMVRNMSKVLQDIL